MSEYIKKGYLHQHFRIFHLKDNSLKDIPFHYHDFHKLILFLDGEAQYIIEGKTYPLKNRDILFVSAGEIHRPITYPDKPPMSVSLSMLLQNFSSIVAGRRQI